MAKVNLRGIVNWLWRALAIAVVLSPAWSVAQTESCAIDEATAKEAVAFLEAAKGDNGVPPECVIGAIGKLRDQRSKEVIDLLTGYIDYGRPREHRISRGANAEQYPATSELFAIGRPVLPALVRVLVRTEVSQVARDNAVRTIMMIYRDDPPSGIHFLVSEAAQLHDRGDASMLRQAASEAVRWCSDRDHFVCEVALSSAGF